MGIYKQRKKWRAEVWIDRRRVATASGFESKQLALDWHRKTSIDYKINPEKLAPPKKETFDDLLGKYLEVHLPTIAPTTQRRYMRDIRLRIRGHFQYRTLDSITPLVLESFRREIMESGLKPKSVNNCTELLRSMFRKGEEWGMIAVNPFKLRSLKIAEQKYTWWEDKTHIMKFLEEAKKDRYYAAYRLSLECGLRLGEVVGLSKQDINFDRNTIHIHRQWLNTEECYGPTKGKTERFVPLNPASELKQALRDAIRNSPHKEAIFVTELGKHVRPRRLAARHFQNVVERAGVPRIRFHDLRHTFASWYMIEVGDIWSLKSLLGHVDVQTTQRYAHLSERHQSAPALSWAMDGGVSEKDSHTPHTPKQTQKEKPLEESRG